MIKRYMHFISGLIKYIIILLTINKTRIMLSVEQINYLKGEWHESMGLFIFRRVKRAKGFVRREGSKFSRND